MIRKSRISPEETSDDPEPYANLRLYREPDVSNIERLMLNTSPLPMAALAGPDHILRYVNAAFCRLAFKTGDELTG